MGADENVERASEPAAEPAAGSAAAGAVHARFAGSTAVGQVREHNEDNFAIANLATGEHKPRDEVCEDEVGERGLMFAVCDGMGGAAAGEVASKMAVDILIEAMRRGDPPADRDALARRLVRAVEEAGKRIYDAAQKERSRRGMGTTATVAVLVDKVMFLAEVGDSRAYLLRRGELKQLTKDQSLVNQLIEAGHLTEDEAEAFEHSNIILQALGTSETVQVDLTFVELRKGDRLMMCSDGLSGLVHAESLQQTLDEIEDPAECTSKLIEYAEQGGGHDNITVIVADFGGEELQEPADSDTFGYLQYPLPLEGGETSAFIDEETASGPSARSNSVSDSPREDEADEALDSTYPVAPAGSDRRSNILWIAGGIAALVIAFAVWVSLEPAAEQAHNVEPEAESAAAPAEPAPEPEELVRVNVHTDVERATLVVNGEPKGALSTDQSRTLELTPGAYRFEAQSEGSPSAVTVKTVRGDTPMDIFLRLPHGTSDSSGEAGGSAEGSETAGMDDEASPAEGAGSDGAEDAKPTAEQIAARKKAREERAARRAAREAQKQQAQKQQAQKEAEASPSGSEGATAAPRTGTGDPETQSPGKTETGGSAAKLTARPAEPAQPEPPSDAPPKPPALPDNPF